MNDTKTHQKAKTTNGNGQLGKSTARLVGWSVVALAAAVNSLFSDWSPGAALGSDDGAKAREILLALGVGGLVPGGVGHNKALGRGLLAVVVPVVLSSTRWLLQLTQVLLVHKILKLEIGEESKMKKYDITFQIYVSIVSIDNRSIALCISLCRQVHQ